MFVRSVWIIIESVLQYKNSQIPSAAIWKLRFKPIAVRRITYFPANIRLNEDVFKTSWSRPIYSSWSYVFKTSSRRFQHVFKTSSRRLAKTSSRHLQDVFKTSSRRLAKTSSRRLQDVLKTSSRYLQDDLQRCLQDVFKTYHRVNLFLVTRFQDVFETFSKRF